MAFLDSLGIYKLSKQFDMNPIKMLRIFTLFLISQFSFTHSTELHPNTAFFGCTGHLKKSSISSVRSRQYKIRHNLSALQIPERFDSRDKWPYCHTIQRIDMQGKCGGCWAFASAAVMSDRLCITTAGKFNRPLSTQDLLECCFSCVGNSSARKGGCLGGYFDKAFKYWMSHGLVTGDGGCKPLNDAIEHGISIKTCRRSCTNANYKIPYSRDKTIARTIYIEKVITAEVLKQVQAEIMLNGPIAAGLLVFLKAIDYVNKQGPKYIWIEDPKIFNGDYYAHAVKIIGWDVMNGVPVWIIANSWGKHWGDNGFFYVRRGFNDFRIESYEMATAVPLRNQPASIFMSETAPDLEASSENMSSFLNYKLALLCTFVWQLFSK